MVVSSFAEIETEFIERVHKMVWCSVATLDSKDRVRSRILHPIWESGTGWSSSRRHSLKEKHLAHSPYVSLAYISDVSRPVYVDCTAEWADEPADKQHLWRLFESSPPPLGFDLGKIFEGVDDPNFGVLRFTPWRIELFDISAPRERKVWLKEKSA
jgi:general stress protein 26